MNTKPAFYSIARVLLALTVLAGLLHRSSASALAASQFDISGPAGSGSFGTSVTVLPNGNIVVTDPSYNGGLGANAGAAYLYNGANGALISTLTGLKANDRVGSGGVVVLSNGNYVVNSPLWDNGATANAGAATWGNGSNGVTGSVTSANSLVGSTASDRVGNGGVVALSNGNYLVRSPDWDNGANIDAGAATWGNGSSGITGPVSSANSLVGSTASDQFGSNVTALSNGNYVVRSPFWNNGATADAGAVTWGSGTSGVAGLVSAANSLVGNTASDQVGSFGVTALSNGNYLVRSPLWNNGATADAGAVTWGSGASGVAGLVSTANSLVGSTASDQVGSGSVTALSNGNYVVGSPLWNNGGILDAGAVTWGSGTSGIVGSVSTSNSLVGSTASDGVGSDGVTALSNGNYVVRSPFWNNGATADAGAVTWGSGTSGVAGLVSAANSLVGSTASDQVGSFGVTALSNGNYVVCSSLWDNGGILNAGAVTWGNGLSGVTGPVSSANSLVGSTASNQVGSSGVTALSNGNYVVRSRLWDNGGTLDVGAVTWGSGTSGIVGSVSTSNSLVGSTTSDGVGSDGVTALSNGNYVVHSPNWDNGATANAGAATWGNGLSGISGPVAAANSLVGSTAGDGVGSNEIGALSNGNYVVTSYNWDNGASLDAGAVTWGSGTSGIVGPVSNSNSLVGSTANDLVGLDGGTALSNGTYVVSSSLWDNGVNADAGAVSWGFRSSGAVGPVSADNSVRGLAASGGPAMVFQYDGINRQLVVGRPFDNIVTLFRLDSLYLPVVSK